METKALLVPAPGLCYHLWYTHGSNTWSLGVVVNDIDLGTLEAGQGEYKFEENLGYIARPCLKKKECLLTRRGFFEFIHSLNQ